jgi:hypothetical protein
MRQGFKWRQLQGCSDGETVVCVVDFRRSLLEKVCNWWLRRSSARCFMLYWRVSIVWIKSWVEDGGLSRSGSNNSFFVSIVTCAWARALSSSVAMFRVTKSNLYCVIIFDRCEVKIVRRSLLRFGSESDVRRWSIDWLITVSSDAGRCFKNTRLRRMARSSLAFHVCFNSFSIVSRCFWMTSRGHSSEEPHVIDCG